LTWPTTKARPPQNPSWNPGERLGTECPCRSGIFSPDFGTEEIVVVAEVKLEAELRNSVDVERAVRNSIVAEPGVSARAVCLKPPLAHLTLDTSLV
jgi:hypothetical protein